MTMSREDAAQRLGMSLREVTAVREHSAGHIATLNGGRPEMLISETVVRAYVPDVDDAPDPEDGDAKTSVSAPGEPARKGSKRG